MTSYAAHIITSEATALGEPEVVVFAITDAETGDSDPVISYPLALEDDEQAAIESLRENHWYVTSEPSDIETGYSIVPVEVRNWIPLLEQVTYARKQAESQVSDRIRAYNLVIKCAVNDGASPTKLAEAAGVSRARIYQVAEAE